jgi:hypothetical protein
MTKDDVIIAAREAHKRFWKATSDESTGDKQANFVVSAWQKEVLSKDSSSYEKEVPIFERARVRIDLVDQVNGIGYELKASGKNPHHEFFKDIFKIITYNHQHIKKIQKFVFISEKQGIETLKQNDLAKAVIDSSNDFGVKIELEPL